MGVIGVQFIDSVDCLLIVVIGSLEMMDARKADGRKRQVTNGGLAPTAITQSLKGSALAGPHESCTGSYRSMMNYVAAKRMDPTSFFSQYGPQTFTPTKRCIGPKEPP